MRTTRRLVARLPIVWPYQAIEMTGYPTMIASDNQLAGPVGTLVASGSKLS